MTITDEQKKLIIEYIPNAEKILNLDDINDLLIELDDVIINQMDENGDLTELGLKLQTLYDEILDQND
ncbi:hypothetical protein SDC9_210071 [bioreactor metagenome]|uniref:Uncharacterized protein n=1 Tax=bioreactor metagenome TaxID=1076179 RepID=A0A645JPY3_9ZZZZ